MKIMTKLRKQIRYMYEAEINDVSDALEAIDTAETELDTIIWQKNNEIAELKEDIELYKDMYTALNKHTSKMGELVLQMVESDETDELAKKDAVLEKAREALEFFMKHYYGKAVDYVKYINVIVDIDDVIGGSKKDGE